jgi:predicted CopG family antitoxin
MPTNVKLQDETWKRLNARKDPGDTFDDVVTRLLDESEENR